MNILELKKWSWWQLCYYSGLLFFIIAVLWWVTSLFDLFANFGQHNGLDLLFGPLLDFFINPFLWVGIVLLKLASWQERRRLKTDVPEEK